MKSTELAWAIIDAVTGHLAVFTGQIPLYWRRRVAIEDAEKHGMTTTGRDPDVRICRVKVSQYSSGKKP